MLKSPNYYEAASENSLKLWNKWNIQPLTSVWRMGDLTSWTVALGFRGLSSSRKPHGYNTYVRLQPVASVVMLIQQQTWHTAIVYDVASPGGRDMATSQPNPWIHRSIVLTRAVFKSRGKTNQVRPSKSDLLSNKSKAKSYHKHNMGHKALSGHFYRWDQVPQKPSLTLRRLDQFNKVSLLQWFQLFI